MCEVTAVLLEDEADHREHEREGPDQEQPPADRRAQRGKRSRQANQERPPAMRTEEAKLAGPLLNVALGIVFWPPRQPPAGEQKIEAGQEREPDGQSERCAARRIVREVPVEDVGHAEEDGAAKEEPALDPHAGTPALVSRSGRIRDRPRSPRAPPGYDQHGYAGDAGRKPGAQT